MSEVDIPEGSIGVKKELPDRCLRQWIPPRELTEEVSASLVGAIRILFAIRRAANLNTNFHSYKEAHNEILQTYLSYYPGLEQKILK